MSIISGKRRALLHDTISDPERVFGISGAIDFFETFRYESKEVVRRRLSGIPPDTQKNPRFPEDLSRRSLVVVFVILRSDVMVSPSRSFRTSVFPERNPEIIKPV